MTAPELLLDPGDARLYGRHGNQLCVRGDGVSARRWYRRGHVLAPRMASMLGALANAEMLSGDPEAARRALLAAIRLEPGRLDLHQNLANLAAQRGRPDRLAAALMRCAVALPATGAAYAALFRLQPEEAWRPRAVLIRRAVLIDPLDAAAATNLGVTFRDAARPGAGLRWLMRALICQPGLAQAANGVANALRARAETVRAMVWYRRALAAAPGTLRLRSNLLMTAQYLPGATAAGLARLHAAHAPHFGPAAPAVRRAPGRPLRVTLVSPNLNRHPVGRLVAGLVEHRDRDDIAITCVSDTLLADRMMDRLRAASDAWHDTRELGDAEWADRVRATGADVLIDLAGHTAGGRMGPLARRLAPVQASWAGYVGTTGLAAFDILVADRFHVPPGEESAYRERVMRLPNGYATYTPPEDAPVPGPPPAVAAGGVTFGCFNNPAKLNRPLVALWAELLRAVPGSRLLLKYRGLDEAWSAASIRAWFGAEGIGGERLVFEGGGPPEAVLEAYRRVDVALDTRPYSGGATTLEALWMGVPVVTWPGESFAGRHSASHLANAGCGDLIARDAAGYVRLAAGLARDPGRLARFRETARARLAAAPIMDHAGFARDFARCLRETVTALGYSSVAG